jgi:acyl-CoA synthetase (NDP forming)/GNAT superfamily N-acetyltransferase
MDTYALLADGTTVEIRPATPGDYDAVKAMHAAMSPDNSYLRFFNFSRLSAEREAERLCLRDTDRENKPGRMALLALANGELAGCGSYDEEPGGTAEIAFAVAEHMHHRGIATLLLEHLVSAARSHSITMFTAQTLGENTPMLHVFADAGLPVQQHYTDGVVEVRIPLPADDTGTALDSYLDRVARRECTADAASLRHIFAPQSVVVIGASRRTGTVGRAIIDNIRTGGYAGRLYAVNPRARQVGGVHCVPSVADLPEAPDLAVIAIPAPTVLDVAEQCGKLGVKALVVVTSGLDTPACADLLAVCRRHGMRLTGPDCFGVAVPGIGLDATFAASHPAPGTAGLVMQSGGLGFAMVDELSRLGIGISSFASVGSKLDVSSNDMLLWWEQDGLTKLAVLYIESFGNPRKFARTARQVGAKMPVLAVLAGRSAAGQRAATAHTAAVATPAASQEALFDQAGIIATRGFGELIETAALMGTQPVPAGRTVAIVSNVGGAGVLAADACADLGLTVHRPRGMVRRKLRTLIPDTGAVTGPVDTTAAVSANDFRQVLELIATDEDVDAIVALVLPTAATGDLTAAIQQAAVGVPLAAVVLNQAESVRMLDGRIPAYAYPEAAVAALARAARYGAWRKEPRGQVPCFPDVQAEDARRLVREFLRDNTEGGWLAPDETAELLRCYGIPLAGLTPVADEEAAVAAAAAAGGPVVLKADVPPGERGVPPGEWGVPPGERGVPGLVHKTEAGAVQLDLRGEDDVRRAYRWLRDRFGHTLRRILIQPMITGGTEVIVGVADDHMFGPLITLETSAVGLGGVTTEVLADHAARLAPLSDTDADKLIHSIRSAPLLLGYRDQPAADLGALRDLLLRVSRLAEDLPEITDLDLNPVIARPDGVFAVDARIKIAPHIPQDPFLRKLRLNNR